MSFKDRLARAVPVWRQMTERSTPFIRQALVTGGAAGSIAVAGIKKGDQLVGVIDNDTTSGIMTDLTSEFVALTDPGWLVKADGVIDNTGGTASTALLVTWIAWAE